MVEGSIDRGIDRSIDRSVDRSRRRQEHHRWRSHHHHHAVNELVGVRHIIITRRAVLAHSFEGRWRPSKRENSHDARHGASPGGDNLIAATARGDNSTAATARRDLVVATARGDDLVAPTARGGNVIAATARALEAATRGSRFGRTHMVSFPRPGAPCSTACARGIRSSRATRERRESVPIVTSGADAIAEAACPSVRPAVVAMKTTWRTSGVEVSTQRHSSNRPTSSRPPTDLLS